MASGLFETLTKIRSILARVQDPLSDDWDPWELGLLIAKLEYEDLDINEQLVSFSVLGEQTKKALAEAGALGFLDQCRFIAKSFVQELGFSGDTVNYYNIKNSYLNDVLLRRKGIPISLSLVFMGLCRYLDIKAVGIGFPGHFLVRLIAHRQSLHASLKKGLEHADDWREQWFVDCFDNAKFVTVQDCERRLNEWTRGVVPFGPDVLKVAHPIEIVSRVLRNLRAIFSEKEDLPRLYWVLTALYELCPADKIEALRERGFLMARMGRFQQATEDLTRYMSLGTDAAKLAHVEKMLRFFATQGDLMN